MALNFFNVLVQLVRAAMFDKVIKPEPKLHPSVVRLNARDHRQNLGDRLFTFGPKDLASLVQNYLFLLFAETHCK